VRLRRLLCALALCMLALAPQAPAATGQAYIFDGATFRIRPTQTIDISGTGSWLLGKFHWRTWTRTRATATGLLYANLCKPTCAAGRFTTSPATVELFAVKQCAGRSIFTRVRVTADGTTRVFWPPLAPRCPIF
jgi:hypothetical protein